MRGRPGPRPAAARADASVLGPGGFLEAGQAGGSGIKGALRRADLLRACARLQGIQPRLRAGDIRISFGERRLLALVLQAQDHLPGVDPVAFLRQHFGDDPTGGHAQSGMLHRDERAFRHDRGGLAGCRWRSRRLSGPPVRRRQVWRQAPWRAHRPGRHTRRRALRPARCPTRGTQSSLRRPLISNLLPHPLRHSRPADCSEGSRMISSTISPSARTTVRGARAANSSSWVTITTVLPAAAEQRE